MSNHMKASAVEAVAAGRQSSVIGREGSKQWALLQGDREPILSPEAKERAKTIVKRLYQLQEVMQQRAARAR